MLFFLHFRIFIEVLCCSLKGEIINGKELLESVCKSVMRDANSTAHASRFQES